MAREVNEDSGRDNPALAEAETTGSALTGFDPARWRAQGFIGNTDQGPREVAGWVNEPFALDFRVWGPGWGWDGDEGYERGWLLSHIPTGFQVLGILAPLDEAKGIVGRIAALTDWSFKDPLAVKGKGKMFEPLIAELGEKLVFRTAQFGPLFASAQDIAQ